VRPTSSGSPRVRASRIAPGFWGAAIAILAIDWATKVVAHVALKPGSSYALAGDAIRFILAFDTRRSFWFGIPGTPFIHVPGGAPAFFAVKLVLLGVILRLAVLLPGRLAPLLGILFGAGVANTSEQVMTGAVINFIDVGVGPHRWPAFNVADAALVTTGLLLAAIIAREMVGERGWRRSLLSTDLSLPRSLNGESRDGTLSPDRSAEVTRE
jgi:lipoprotein signal peptidase